MDGVIAILALFLTLVFGVVGALALDGGYGKSAITCFALAVLSFVTYFSMF